jgi:hypothetical protein
MIASSRGKKCWIFSCCAGREPEEAGGERGQAGGDAAQHAGARDGAARQGRHQANRSRDCRQGQGRAGEPGSLPGADQAQGQGAQVMAQPLKVLSSEMDPAEIRLIRLVFIKERGAVGF